MNILRIDTDCTDNGSGIRTTIYIAGCWHYCKGCHNPESWNCMNGKEYEINKLVEIINENPIANVTLSGGDPLTYQYEYTLKLLKKLKTTTTKNVWVYTGYLFEELKHSHQEALELIDVLVDGKFLIEKKDLSLQFRGSSNQRMIDVQPSLKTNEIQLWNKGLYI